MFKSYWRAIGSSRDEAIVFIKFLNNQRKLTLHIWYRTEDCCRKHRIERDPAWIPEAPQTTQQSNYIDNRCKKQNMLRFQYKSLLS